MQTIVLSRTICKLWLIIGQSFAIARRAIQRRRRLAALIPYDYPDELLPL